MQYCQLGRTGYEVSRVVYGGIVSAERYGGTVLPVDGQKASDEDVAWAVERGINYFDVAPSYGNAEERLGHSLLPYRKRVYLACKTQLRTRREAEAEMRKSLSLLHTDYFDVYQMHCLASMEDLEQAFGPGGVMELLRDMKEKGTARKIGFTAHSEAVALRALEMYDFDTVLFPFNWHMHMACGMGGELARAAKAAGVGLLGMKALIERAWTDEERYASRYPKSWCKPLDLDDGGADALAAMRYALSLGVDTLVPPGNSEHFRFCAEHIGQAVETPLSEEEKARLERRLEQVREHPFFQPLPERTVSLKK